MPKQIAIITGDFHKELAQEMVSWATDEITAGGAAVSHDIRVAGSYEVPLMLDKVLGKKKVDAAVVLGYIEKGETMHGEVMGRVAHAAIVELQLKHGKPVGVGIIGPGATKEQAQVRKEGAARGSVKAVLRSLAALKGF
ncbi:MAG: 6,7-dimethyl-8-ribityllumazine synthase [Candidatus Andersenbacteria bacterium]|nr:6,7-dimethyl-8-ribityllumazine synthase [Candidatus Andersenbacteria bacterium]